MNRSEALNRGLVIVESRQFMSLGTIGSDGFPRIRTLFNLRSAAHYPHIDRSIFGDENRFILYMGTNTSSVKMTQIRSNPRISAYFTDMKTWEGILLIGNAGIVTDREEKKAVWDPSWIRYYREGLEDPDFTLLRLRPVKAEIYGGMEAHRFEGEELLAR